MTKNQAFKKAGLLADQLKRHCKSNNLRCLLFVEQAEGTAKIGHCNDAFLSDIIVDTHLSSKEAAAEAHSRLLKLANGQKDVPAAVS